MMHPGLPHPAGARPSGAVHVELYAAGQKSAIAERGWDARSGIDSLQGLARRGYGRACIPQNANAFLELPCRKQSLVRVPLDWEYVRIFYGGHALAEQSLLNVQNS